MRRAGTRARTAFSDRFLSPQGWSEPAGFRVLLHQPEEMIVGAERRAEQFLQRPATVAQHDRVAAGAGEVEIALGVEQRIVRAGEGVIVDRAIRLLLEALARARLDAEGQFVARPVRIVGLGVGRFHHRDAPHVLLRMFRQMRGIVAAREADLAFARQPFADRGAELRPGRLAALLDRAAFGDRFRVEAEQPVVAAGADEIALLLFVLAGAAAADHDEAVIVEQQRGAATAQPETAAVAIDADGATLKNGVKLQADLIVAGIGVRPRVSLADSAGLAVDRGLLVNAYLETSAPGVFAAGDIARWPDPHTGQSIRVEHWVVAERQGQTAALNMLGERQAFDAVPFFWSQHCDMQINYVGHAEHWDELIIEGDVCARNCVVRYRSKGRTLAVASINRDLESLRAELALERADHS